MPLSPPVRALPPPPPNEGTQVLSFIMSSIFLLVAHILSSYWLPIFWFLIYSRILNYISIRFVDCSYLACVDPLTNTPPGSPCGCVFPMQVGLRLSVELYTFFPLVSELAEEIAVGVFVKQSQVRIMGANAATQDPEKTIVLIDLVPLEEKFDNTTAYLIFQRIWLKQIAISTSLFGNYEILYVRYPGI